MRLRHPGIALLGLAAVTMAAGPAHVHAQAYQFRTFDCPGAADTYAHGINNAGQIVGRYDSSGSGVSSGFSVNAGSLSSGGFSTYSTGDAFTEFDAVNDAGQIVGDYVKNGDGTNPGFLLNGSSHTDFNPGGTFTIPAGVNASGAVSGTSFNANSLAQGFVRSSGGTVTFFSDPKADAQGTFGTGLNDAGTAVGYYFNGGGYNTAFMDKNGVFTDLAIPATYSTIAYEINNGGDVVGFYQTPGATAFSAKQGFLLTGGGSFLTINVPGAVSTEIFGVNDGRQVVGDYTDAVGNTHGFFATPAPEPSPWTTWGLGTLTLGALALTAFRRLSVLNVCGMRDV